MTTVAVTLAALPAVIALYTYLLYPAVLWAIGRLKHGTPPVRDAGHPLVTVVVPAYNEARQIRGAIEALLRQDYPKDRFTILVLSDASTDETDDIVREYAAQGVELMRMPSRSGKTAAENASVSRIRGDIVVNTDASIRLHPEAVRHLVAAMADPEVGVASSRDMSMATSMSADNVSEAGYVGYEMHVRALETRAGGIVGASGSGYAIRAELHQYPVPADLSRDFSAALTAHRHGFRAVSVDRAICGVPRTGSLSREYSRKVRTISRGMDTLHFNRDLLNVARGGGFAWKLFSHKLCRWLVPVSVLPAALGLAFLALYHRWALLLLAAMIVAGTVGVMAVRWPESRSLPRWMPVGMLGALTANLAVVHAAWRFLRGHHDHIWEPTRRVATSDEAAEPSVRARS